jgi:glycosyltransferase involved in cell wall biosynthesis
MSARPVIPLTLIIPVYGRQDGLDRALASLVDQDAAFSKVIVVDDASPTPVTISAAMRSALNIDLLRQKENSGPAAARNAGLRAAATEWVSFLDSDDRLLPGTLGARWRLLEESQARDPDDKTIFGCSWIDVDAAGAFSLLRHPRPSTGSRDFASGCWFSPGSCILIHLAAALEAAGYQDERLRRLEDFDWFLNLGLNGFQFRPQPVVGVQIERRRMQNPETLLKNAAIIREKWKAVPLDPGIARRREAYLDLEIAAAYRYAGHMLKAARWLARSFLKVPRRTLQLSPAWDIETVRRPHGTPTSA